MIKKIFITITVFLCMSANLLAENQAWHFTPADVNALHSKPADFRIPYGDDLMQFGDLRLPKSKGPYPVAIIIHGGCWTSSYALVQNTAALADALRDQGIATWNIEYREIDKKGGGWPGTFEDAAHAADYLREIAEKYSLDLNRIIVIGQSAGGHLALWLAGRHNLSKNSQLYIQNPIVVQGVIEMGGVPDLALFRKQGEKVCDGNDVVGKLLGKNETEIKEHYLQASPIDLLPLNVDQFLIYGMDDQTVPSQYAENYLNTARRKGDHVQLIKVRYGAHHEYNVPNSVVWPEIQSAIKFLLHKAMPYTATSALMCGCA